MKTTLYQITFFDLLWLFIPLSIVFFFYIKWSGDKKTIIISIIRMFLQLLLIGYFLQYIFQSSSSLSSIAILSVMLFFASIIALRPLKDKTRELYLFAFVSIFIGGVTTLLLVIFGVLGMSEWYNPRFLIPLAGMIFANSMNGVSIAAERYDSEREKSSYIEARSSTYKAALIPIINSFFAVGVVSLPGMMTGQILSGVDPLIAVRYQMMVMLMILSSTGISVAVYLILVKRGISNF